MTLTPDQIAAERVLFEATIRNAGGVVCGAISSFSREDEGGPTKEYRSAWTEQCWQSWLSRAEIAHAEKAEACASIIAACRKREDERFDELERQCSAVAKAANEQVAALQSTNAEQAKEIGRLGRAYEVERADADGFRTQLDAALAGLKGALKLLREDMDDGAAVVVLAATITHLSSAQPATPAPGMVKP